jgi:hypothetical protein
MAHEVTKAKMGRPSSYKPEFAKMARHLCKLGATDADLAAAFEVSIPTIDTWKTKHPDFLGSLNAAKAEADARVERALYQRAVGYERDAVKIFCDKNGKVTKVPYREHVPPDVTACIFWLKNRDPAHWRDAWQVEHSLGKYMISDKPMTKEAWAKERATIIDAEATEIAPPASRTLPNGEPNKSNRADK